MKLNSGPVVWTCVLSTPVGTHEAKEPKCKVTVHSLRFIFYMGYLSLASLHRELDSALLAFYHSDSSSARLRHRALHAMDVRACVILSVCMLSQIKARLHAA